MNEMIKNTIRNVSSVDVLLFSFKIYSTSSTTGSLMNLTTGRVVVDQAVFISTDQTKASFLLIWKAVTRPNGHFEGEY